MHKKKIKTTINNIYVNSVAYHIETRAHTRAENIKNDIILFIYFTLHFTSEFSRATNIILNDT